MAAKSRLSTHLIQPDPRVPLDTKGRATCRCGLPEDHPRHTLPDVPGQAAVAARYDPEGGV